MRGASGDRSGGGGDTDGDGGAAADRAAGGGRGGAGGGRVAPGDALVAARDPPAAGAAVHHVVSTIEGRGGGGRRVVLSGPRHRRAAGGTPRVVPARQVASLLADPDVDLWRLAALDHPAAARPTLPGGAWLLDDLAPSGPGATWVRARDGGECDRVAVRRACAVGLPVGAVVVVDAGGTELLAYAAGGAGGAGGRGDPDRPGTPATTGDDATGGTPAADAADAAGDADATGGAGGARPPAGAGGRGAPPGAAAHRAAERAAAVVADGDRPDDPREAFVLCARAAPDVHSVPPLAPVAVRTGGGLPDDPTRVDAVAAGGGRAGAGNAAGGARDHGPGGDRRQRPDSPDRGRERGGGGGGGRVVRARVVDHHRGRVVVTPDGTCRRWAVRPESVAATLHHAPVPPRAAGSDARGD